MTPNFNSLKLAWETLEGLHQLGRRASKDKAVANEKTTSPDAVNSRRGRSAKSRC